MVRRSSEAVIGLALALAALATSGPAGANALSGVGSVAFNPPPPAPISTPVPAIPINPPAPTPISVPKPAVDPAIIAPDHVLPPAYSAFRPADLVLERFDVQETGGGYFHLSATLRNGEANGYGAEYAGGGRLVLRRTSGCVILTPPNADGSPSLIPSEPDPGVLIRQIWIPSLAYGQAIEISATLRGRGIFAAEAVSDPPNPLREADPNNNSKTVNTLISRTIYLNTISLGAMLRDTLDNVAIRLDRNESFVRVPGFIDMRWALGEKTQAIGIGAVRYYVHDINLSQLEMRVEDHAMKMDLEFETAGPEIYGYLYTEVDTSDPAVPDVNTDTLKVSVKLPLAFDPETQAFSYHSPKFDLQANWQFNGVLGWGLMGWARDLLPDVNGKINHAAELLLQNDRFKRVLEYRINQQVRRFLGYGRITGINFDDPSQLVIYAETA